MLISHAFGADDLLASSLVQVLKRAGFDPFNSTTFSDCLSVNYARGSDRVDLDQAFRRGGRSPSAQERSDPALFTKLVRALAEQNTLVVLWSAEYAARYWTRIEWTTALAMCKRLVILKLDDTHYCPTNIHTRHSCRLSG